MLVVLLPPIAHAQSAWDKAVAEINEAIETNPNGAPPDSISTCRSMLDTAKLLRKMGKTDRAIRRLKACRRLLGLGGDQSRQLPARRLECFV